MKILFKHITSAFVKKEIELAEAGSLALSLLNFAVDKNIQIYHAGKNLDFWDNIVDVNFNNFTVDWGGYGSKISVEKLYDYFKFIYPGDENIDGKIKSKVNIKSKPFTLVKAFFEEDVDKDIIKQFLNLGGIIGFVEDLETELWVTKDKLIKEKKHEKSQPYMEGRDNDFIFMYEEDLKALFPQNVERTKQKRKIKEDILSKYYNAFEIVDSLVSNKKQFQALKKLLESGNKELIENGLSLLSALEDPYLLDTILLTVDFKIINGVTSINVNPLYKGLKTHIPYYNYVITAVLYFANSSSKRTEEIKRSFSNSLMIDIIDLKYLHCFKNIEFLFLSDSLNKISNLNDLPESWPLKKLHLIECVQLQDIDRLSIFPISDFDFGVSKFIKSFKALRDKKDETQKLELNIEALESLESLDGIQFYQSLERLKLCQNLKISDCSPLYKLINLKYIEGGRNISQCNNYEILFNNQNTSLSIVLDNWVDTALIKSEFLTKLYIHCDVMYDLEWLVGFPNLSDLTFYGKNLEDIGGLRHVKKLEKLRFQADKIKNLSGIENLNDLKSLNLRAKSIKHVDELSNLEKLEEFDFYDLDELISLEGFFRNKNLAKKVTNIDLSYATKVIKLGNLSLFEKLSTVYLRDLNSFNDLINDLNTSKSLNLLTIQGRNVKFNNPVICNFEVKIYNIDEIDLSNCGIQDLIIERCDFKNLSGIENMAKLKSLKILECEQLESLDGLKHLPSLKSIKLYFLSKLININAIRNIPSLEFLDFSYLPNVKNVSSLANLPNLIDFKNIENADFEVPLRLKRLDKEKVLSYKIKLAEIYKLDILFALKEQKEKIGDEENISRQEDKKLLNKIKKLLQTRDCRIIDTAIILLQSLNSETIINELLEGIDFSYNCFKLNALFSGNGPAQRYLNYALFGVLHCANSFEKWKKFNASIEELNLVIFEVAYLNQFINLKRIYFSNVNSFLVTIDLPNLEKLDLSFGDSWFSNPTNDRIFKFDSICNCKKIKEINIRDTIIKGDLTILENMFDLESIVLNYCNLNELNSFEPLKKATKLFNLNFNPWQKCVTPIKSLKGLENCRNIKSLIIEDTILEDTTALLELDKLEVIEIIGSKIKTMTLPKSLKHLKRLKLENSPIEKIIEIQVPELVDEIKLNCLNIENINFLKGVKEIKRLEIFNCSLLKDLKGLSTLQSVKEYGIRKCFNLIDVNDFLKLNILSWDFCFKKIPSNIIQNKVKHLVLNDLETLDGIEQFPEIEILNLAGSNIKDLNGIGKLKRLKYLNLHSCQNLTTLQGIEDLTSLNFLGINYTTNLSDINSLEKMIINVVLTKYSNLKKSDFPYHLQNSINHNSVASLYDDFYKV